MKLGVQNATQSMTVIRSFMSNEKPREFWIFVSSVVLLNNRKHYAYDKEMYDEIYYNDPDAYKRLKDEGVHTIEFSAFEALQKENLRLEYESEAANALGDERMRKLEAELQNLQKENEQRREALENVSHKMGALNMKLKAELQSAMDRVRELEAENEKSTEWARANAQELVLCIEKRNELRTENEKLKEEIEKLKKPDRCPCGGVILADTEDCTTMLCDECANEIFVAYGGLAELKKRLGE